MPENPGQGQVTGPSPSGAKASASRVCFTLVESSIIQPTQKSPLAHIQKQGQTGEARASYTAEGLA